MTAALGESRSGGPRNPAGETPTGPIPAPQGSFGGPDTGRHAAPVEAVHGTMGELPAGMRSRDAHAGGRRSRGPQQPARRPGAQGPVEPLSRAARTAGLSLAALGALAGAGGVATGQLAVAADEPAPTGEFALPTHLTAADMSLASSGSALDAAEASAPTAPSVMPASFGGSPSVSPVSMAGSDSAQEIKTSSPSSRAAEAREAEAESERAEEAKAEEAKAEEAKAEEAKAAEAASSSSSEVVDLAKGQVGVPYVWGGTSTSGFDCSGLVQWAYEKVGKDLPRTSAAQSKEGREVSRDELQPGDLIFMYSPVTHVAMYAGDGKIVEAPQSGSDVRVTDLDRYDGKITGMRRV